MKGKTVIVVAHRLSTIANLDRILVFDEGRIIEDGRPMDLLGQQGAYYRLWSRQADGFLGGSIGPASPTAETVRDEVGFVSSPAAVEETPGESDDSEPTPVAMQPVPQFARPL
jgi:ABC-type multidrug transport system ATPase subunit